MIMMNPAPCAPCASSLSSLFCPPCPPVTEPLPGLRDPRGGGTCSDSPDDSSQSPSRTCRAALGDHLEEGSESFVEGNVHLFEAEDDACPLSGLQASTSAKFIVVVDVHSVVGSASSSTEAPLPLPSLWGSASPASSVILVMRERRLRVLSKLLILHDLLLTLDLLSLRGHVLVHEDGGEQALLEKGLGRGLLCGEQGAVHSLLVALGD